MSDDMPMPIISPEELQKAREFKAKLEALINEYSIESNSNTPDFILADYLMKCLMNFDFCVTRRDQWYGLTPEFQKTLKKEL